jgi:hypothetical protein
MKKILLFISFNLLIGCVFSEQIITTGYYISKSDDTIQCKFSLKIGVIFNEIDTFKMQFGITVLDSFNKEKFFEPCDIKGFLINYKGTFHVFHSLVNTPGYSSSLIKDPEPFIFLELVCDGYLKLYCFKDIRSGPNYTRYGVNIAVLKKGKEPITGFENWFWNGSSYYKELGNYFLEYTDLSEKIKRKTYKGNDIILISKKYNQWIANGGIFVEDTTIYTNVETIPTFKYKNNESTSESINQFFHSKIKLPSSKISGQKAIFQAVVEKDGLLNNVKLLRGISDYPELTNEVLKAANHMPLWSQGKLKDKEVRTSITFIVKLSKY